MKLAFFGFFVLKYIYSFLSWIPSLYTVFSCKYFDKYETSLWFPNFLIWKICAKYCGSIYIRGDQYLWIIRILLICWDIILWWTRLLYYKAWWFVTLFYIHLDINVDNGNSRNPQTLIPHEQWWFHRNLSNLECVITVRDDIKKILCKEKNTKLVFFCWYSRIACIKQTLSMLTEAIEEYKLILKDSPDYVPALKGDNFTFKEAEWSTKYPSDLS